MTGAQALRPAARERAIVTPDGVALTVTIADLPARAAAGLVDFGLIVAVAVGVLILTALTVGASGSAALELAGLLIFLLRLLYFPYFEMSWGGRTPGKRALGLRVIDRNGGGLTGEAVLARNLVREVEFFLPLTLMLTQPDLTGHVWGNVAAYGFIAAVLAIPLLNRERMRVGDVAAGTWVVFETQAALAPDLAADAAAVDAFTFTDAQLAAYGVKELETLASVLRDRSPRSGAVRRKVTDAITTKIEFETVPDGQVDPFLRAFYAALRGALEQRKVATGQAPADKHARAAASAGAPAKARN